MSDADNLVAIHKRLKTGKGRRIEELALNRAVVVVTVAAWQGYVQDIARIAIDTLRPPTPPFQAWNLLNAQATRAIQMFSTPNAERTQELLLHAGFDPLPHWTWTFGPEHLTPPQTAERMNRWLKVRHAIAHGHD